MLEILEKEKLNIPKEFRYCKDKEKLNYFLKELVKAQNIFENNLDKNYRQLNGTYLTNKFDTINNINDVVDSNNIIDKKILEPSCGQGIFLLNLITRVYEKFPNEKIIYDFIENNLIFVDIDPIMIEKTKENIQKLYIFLFNKKYTGHFNGFKHDFTKKSSTKQTLFGDNSEKSSLFNFLGEIDYVIGNPPYVSLYGRRDKKKNEQQRIYYLDNYNQFPSYVKNGKINLVMLFLEHSLDFLKKDGVLSMIIDISFFETAYKHTRKYLLENTSILSLDINISDFDVVSGQLILKIKKEKRKGNIVSIKDTETKKEILIKQDFWLNSEDEYKFRINFCEKSLKIIKKIHNKKNQTLKDIYPDKNLRTCVMLLDMEDKFIYKTLDNLPKEKTFPYYQGSKGLSEKFGKLSHSKYFYYDKKLQDEINEKIKIKLTKKGIKNKKRIGFGELDIYKNPKVYIRQSAKEIVASYEEVGSSSNNSLYVFSLRKNDSHSKEFLKFLCGLLNSDLITFYAQKRSIIRYSKGKQPQIKISDLYSIYIPNNKKIQKDVANLVHKIYKNSNKKEKYIEDINNIIFNYYNITKSEIFTINKELKSF